MTRLRSDRLVTGGLIILVGVLLLLSTTDAFPTESVWDFFPSVFVLLGLWALVRSGFRNRTGPVMVIAVAATYQLKNLGYVSDQAVGTWWPLFVVLFGVLFLLDRSSRSRGSSFSVSENDAGEVALASFFSGSRRRVTGTRFRGGDIFVLFGGAELDLRDADIEDTASVECLVLFGGADVYAPEEWRVRLDVLSVFGGSTDERPPQGDGATGDAPELVVTGLALFGGVSVKR
jgi:hypothetical protein